MIKEIIGHGDRLFKQRGSLLFHWQELAEHFHYQRATFMGGATIEKDYANNIMSSTAALARREMGDMYRTMLRPVVFFDVGVPDMEFSSEEAGWFEWAGKQMRADMYRKGGNFTRATTVTDHDHATFGQGAIEVNVTPNRDEIYYTNHHLRDVVWSVDYAGNVETVHRNCTMTVSQCMTLFPNKVPSELVAQANEDPHAKVKARHVVAPARFYDGINAVGNHPYVSVWVLTEHEAQLESVTRPFMGYVIPRAELYDGSQYASSPLTSIILPDAKTKNAIERIIMEAGEKAVDPPMVGVKEALRGDLGLYAGGVTFVDADYDERTGEVLRPINQDRSGLPVGLDMSMQYDRVISEGMKLNKINLPETGGERTAYETRKLIEQHMRANVPMWEPVETEYNEPLVSETFAALKSIGRFPSEEMPDVLRGADVDFEFKSPVKDMEKESKPQQMVEGLQIVQSVAEFRPEIVNMVNFDEMTVDALRAVGWNEEWLISDDEYQAKAKAMKEQMQAQQEMAEIEQGAEIAGKAAPMAEFMQGLTGG